MNFDSKCGCGSTRAHLLAGAALAALIVPILPAAGQNATWNATATVAGPTPGTFDFNAPANWTPNAAPIGPTGTAFFGATTTPNLSFSAQATIDGWTFNVGASAYTFTNEQLIFFTGAGILINGGSATITNNGLGGIIIFRNFSTAGDATFILQNSIISFFDHSTAGSATFYNNGAIGFSGSSRADNATFINNNAIVFFDFSSGSTARFINGTGGYIDLSLLTNAGMTAGSIEGAGNIFLGGKNLEVGSNNLSTTYAGMLRDGGLGGGSGGSLTKEGAGTLTLSGTSTYTGPTTVNAGALIVDGSIASSVLATVNSGGLLSGSGTVGNTQINAGGTFAPGPQNAPGSITVAGNLAFQAGALYLVQLAATASIADVTGTATLAGNVLANFAPGSYITRQYTILHADGGLGGTTFGGIATNNPNFNSSLSYDANDVFLNLTAALGKSVNGLNQNQVNVATAINGFFNNGGVLPPNFLSLFNLTGPNLATTLSLLSGEAATAAQYGAFQLGNQFFSLMLDPLVYGRSPNLVAPAGVGPMRLAAEETQAPEIALAYAKILKEPPAPAPILWEPRWNAWAGGYGGYNRTQGDPVVVGSHDVTARTGGYGAGIDYRIWPGTTVGVALAGGFTNWGLASGLGGGNSDAFQAGLYGITRNGPAYLAGALAFTQHWTATDRFAFAGDHVTARFNAQSYGGRIESGWRFVTFLGGVAPYAAVQAQAFHTPAYNETDATFGGFGLNYNARNGSDTRSELGARFDHALPIATTAVLALNARAAWAHDRATTPILNPFFQTLPGTLFSVTGATPVPNSALASAGAELRFFNGWAIGARFDGEFAERAQTYAGTGTLRYVW